MIILPRPVTLSSLGAQPASANLDTYAGIAPSSDVQALLAAANDGAIRSAIGALGGLAEATDVMIPITTHAGITIAGTWVRTRQAAGKYRWRRLAAAGVGSIAVEAPCHEIRSTANRGAKIVGFVFQWTVSTEAANDVDFSPSYTVFPADGNAIAAATAMGGTWDAPHDTAAERGTVGEHTGTFTLTSPVYLTNLLNLEFVMMVDDTTGGGALVDLNGARLLVNRIPVDPVA